MKTANFITASAEITSIVNLKKGDVYKRLDDDSYGEDKIIHGIVLDILYNGEDAAVQAMEFSSSYKNLKTEFKVFSGKKEIKIFPATQEEVKEYLAECITHIQDEITDKKKELAESEDKLVRAKDITTGDLIKKLTTPEFTSTPTKELQEA